MPNTKSISAPPNAQPAERRADDSVFEHWGRRLGQNVPQGELSFGNPDSPQIDEAADPPPKDRPEAQAPLGGDEAAGEPSAVRAVLAAAGLDPDTCISTPATELGGRFALIPERLLGLPATELLVLAVLLSMRRRETVLGLSFADLGQSLGLCSRTLAAHVESLRARGLVSHVECLRVTPLAMPRKGERFARVATDRASVIRGAAFRVLAYASLNTDRKGRRRVTWKWLAARIGCSLRTVMLHLAALRAVGVVLAKRAFRRAAKTFTSARKHGSRALTATLSLSRKGGQERGVSLRSVPPPPPPLRFDRDAAHRRLAAWGRRHGVESADTL